MKILDLLNLSEGLIKIPSNIFSSVMKAIYSDYISFIYNNEYTELATTLARKHNIVVNKNFKLKNEAIDLDIVIDDLPQKVKDSWKLEFGYLKLIIDWEQKIWAGRPKVNASYEESNDKGLSGHITINPLALMTLVEAKELTDKNIDEIFEKLRTSMWHELSHAIQHNSLKWVDVKQVGKSRVVRDNPDSSKSERRNEYLSSLVEFDPTLKTKILKFKPQIDTNPKVTLQNLAIFVGSVKDSNKEPDEFFNALKLTDIKRWKKAVKLFYLNYGFDPSTLLEK